MLEEKIVAHTGTAKSLLLVLAFVPASLVYSPYYTAILIGFINFFSLFGIWRVLKVRSFWSFVWPLFALLLLGIVGGVNNAPKDFTRDFLYLSSVLTIVMMGAWFGLDRIAFRSVNRHLLVLGSFMAAYQLTPFMLRPSLVFEPFNVIVESIPSGSELTVYALAIVTMRTGEERAYIVRSRLLRILLAIALAVAVLLSFSRSMIFSAALLCILVNARFRTVESNRRLLVVVTIVAAAALFSVIAGSEEFGLVSKTRRAFTEIKPSEYSSNDDINLNWRGYEAYRGLVTFASGNALQKTFGQGFGSKIDLGIVMVLGDAEYDEIPNLHNGYISLLVKTGISGVVLYLAFFYMYFWREALRPCRIWRAARWRWC